MQITIKYLNEKKQLEKACTSKGHLVRSNTEAVIFLVPMRNIESWFRYLSNRDWNETEKFRQTKDDNLAKEAASNLHRMCFDEQKLGQPAPSSLEDACLEWERF